MSNEQFNNGQLPYQGQPVNQNQVGGGVQATQQPVYTQPQVEGMQGSVSNQMYTSPQHPETVVHQAPVQNTQVGHAPQTELNSVEGTIGTGVQPTAVQQQYTNAPQQQYVAEQATVPVETQVATAQHQQSVVTAPPEQVVVNQPISPSALTGETSPTNVMAESQGVYALNADIEVDIGNSGTRVVVDVGATRFYFEMSNHYARVPALDLIAKKYFNRRTTIIQDKVTGDFIVNGQYQEVEASSKYDKPVGFKSKASQDVTYHTLRTVVARVLFIVSEYFKLNLDNVQVNLTMSVLFPPLNTVREGELLRQNAETYGLLEVACYSPIHVNKSINLDIKTKAEGVSGFFTAFYKEKGVVPVVADADFSAGNYLVYDMTNAKIDVEEANEKFHTGDLLLIDIGGGTTDVLLARDMEIIEESRETFSVGGNTVEALIAKEIRRDFGYSPSDLQMKEIVTAGKFTEGDQSHNAIHYISKARNNYAVNFKPLLVDYFNALVYNPRQLKGLIVFGGGALETVNVDVNEKAEAMVKVIIDYLKEDLCPRIEEVYVDKTLSRKANVLGASMQSRY